MTKNEADRAFVLATLRKFTIQDGFTRSFHDAETGTIADAIISRLSPENARALDGDVEAEVSRRFVGYGVAIRCLDEPPIPGEPFMSMAEAKRITCEMLNGQLASTKQLGQVIDALRASLAEAYTMIEAVRVAVRGPLAPPSANPENARVGVTDMVLMPREAGPCENDSDGFLLKFVAMLHVNVSPESSRPVGWCDFSDEQRERIRNAYNGMVLAALDARGSGHE